MAACCSSSEQDLCRVVETLQSESLNPKTVSFYLSEARSGWHHTSTSLTVHISPSSLPLFPQILATSAALPSLSSLLFHLTPWDPPLSVHLTALLQSSPSLSHLVFSRSTFHPLSLSALSHSLESNTSLASLTFSECSLRSQGAAAIANSLKLNHALEELHIWDDSIGLAGAEDLANMIEINSSLNLLMIFDSRHVTAVPLLAAALARNRIMDLHFWTSGNHGGPTKVVEYGNDTLRIYWLDTCHACRVGCSLGFNTTVRHLDMTGVKLGSSFCKEFRWVLEQNRTLTEVKLSKSGIKNKGVVYLSAGLFKNTSLRSLYLDGNEFNGVGLEHLLCPLSRFSSLQLQANVTLKQLIFGGKAKMGSVGVSAIVRMITTNETLTKLGIHDDCALTSSDFVKILKSLEKNLSIKSLSFQGCKGVRGEHVAASLTEMMTVNGSIEELDLSRTLLHEHGKVNRREEPEAVDSNVVLTAPKSCRVFLCGHENSGKQTLCNTMSQKFSYMSLTNANGIRIKTFNDGDTKIALWNLENHHDVVPLHDLIFASSFLIISNLFKKEASEVEDEVHYWLKFIVSSSSRAQQCMLPRVTIVLSHYDKIALPSEPLTQSVTLIRNLREKFQEFVEMSLNVFPIDARSSASVSTLAHHVRATCRSVLDRVPKVYHFCNDLVDGISEWRKQNRNRPTMKWKEFGDVCQMKVPYLRVRTRDDVAERDNARRRATALCLHQMGEVVFFEELGFLIVDCEWFFGEALHHLITIEEDKKGAFVKRKELEKILANSKILEFVDASDILRLMIKLELCHVSPPESDNSLVLITSMLEDSRSKPQRWHLASDCVYVGRHFQPDDSGHKVLTRVFFPRLQCSLRIKLGHNAATYELEKNLISISMNGAHIRVELGGKMGCYVDVLACSTKNITDTVRLIRQLIVPSIHAVCNEVNLIESVIRPECVRDLTPPRYRRTQSIPLQNLKQSLLSVPADGIYDYQHTWRCVIDSGRTVVDSGFDYARDLLSDDDFRDVLHRRYNDLHSLAVELDVQSENESQMGDRIRTNSVDPSFEGIAKGVEQVLQRLKIIEHEIRDLKQEIKGLRYYEHRLLLELTRKINYLATYNAQIEERKIPNMFFFVRTENYTRRLVTYIVPGMSALRLHMLCEFRREMHVVEDQLGCEMMQIDNTTAKRVAPYMRTFMTLLTLGLKIGAHMVAGMGEMIPDLGREVSRMAGSSIAYGAGGVLAAGAVGVAAMDYRERSRNVRQEQEPAQQWLIDFMRERNCSSGRDIAEKFGLWRVRYRDDGQIAWICRRHLSSRANDLFEVPL